MEPGPDVILTPRLAEALALAIELHGNQPRKGTGIPYVSHLLGVCSLVLEHGGDEDEAVAALLHDAAEDQGGERTLGHIRQAFGEAVADTVEGCSDTLVEPKPPWRERKQRYIEHVRGAPEPVLRVSAADKLHNVRAMLSDYHVVGEALWERFNAGPEEIDWYHRGLVDAFREAGAPGALVDELERTTRALGALQQAR